MFSQRRNQEIREYTVKTFVKENDAIKAAKERAEKEHLPHISVSPNVGKLLAFLASLHQPKRILEIGTLAGYSTLWLAEGAPQAEIITIENNPKHAQVARENFSYAKKEKIQLIEEDALITLEKFLKEKHPPFDFIFLDAYKEGYPLYLPFLLQLSRDGTLLITDNLIPREEKINAPDPGNQIAVRTYEYNSLLSSNPHLNTIPIYTLVGDEGRLDALGITVISKS